MHCWTDTGLALCGQGGIVRRVSDFARLGYWVDTEELMPLTRKLCTLLAPKRMVVSVALDASLFFGAR